MRVHRPLPLGALTRVVSRIKVISQLDIADRMRPQGGRARMWTSKARTMTSAYRLAVPTRAAEKAVIRILRSDTAKTLEGASLPAPGARAGAAAPWVQGGNRRHRHRADRVRKKTTTLYAALRELAQRGVNIMTVEDPVEYELGGITQMQVDPKRGVTFASALKAILRQDPDVVFVGEIRDLETAEVAVQAALTGHLVLATMHTNDALGAVARLHDLGVDQASISSSLRGSIAQRLVRRVCGECARPATTPFTDEELRLSSAYGTAPTVRALGCSACGNTGYRGRMPIIEVAVISPAIADLISDDSGAAALRRAAADAGMPTPQRCRSRACPHRRDHAARGGAGRRRGDRNLCQPHQAPGVHGGASSSSHAHRRDWPANPVRRRRSGDSPCGRKLLREAGYPGRSGA